MYKKYNRRRKRHFQPFAILLIVVLLFTLIFASTSISLADDLIKTGGLDAGSSEPVDMDISPFAVGDVVLLDFLIADGIQTPSDTSIKYSTANSTFSQINVRGTYEIQNNGVSDALVSITLANQDLENYFGAGNGSHNYFITNKNNIAFPKGSDNQTVTATSDGNGVVVSFTVSGNKGDSGTFNIGYVFNDAVFDGWLPAGKLLANVTGGGDVTGAKTLTVTAEPPDRARLTFDSNLKGDIGLDQIALLTLHAEQGGWRFEPGTTIKLELEHPTDAMVTIPANPNSYGGTAPTITSTDNTSTSVTTILFDLDKAQADGHGNPAIWNAGIIFGYNTSKMIALSFPSGDFSEGETVDVTARLTYTLAGTTAPREIEIIVSHTIVGKFIHVAPADLAMTGGPVVLNIDGMASTNSAIQSLHTSTSGSSLKNAGTLPVPEVFMTWINGVGSATNKVNIYYFSVSNDGAMFKTHIVFTIDGPGGPREVDYILPAAASANASSTMSNTLLTNTTALQQGEYVSQIKFYPLLNDISEPASVTAANPVHGLPLSAGIRTSFTYCPWTGGIFPDGTAIKQNDVVHIGYEAGWQGESKPDLHDTASVVSKTAGDASGGTTVLLRYTDRLDRGSIYYGHNPVYPYLSMAYLTGENGTKLPGQSVGVKLNIGQVVSKSANNWNDPIVYYFPPDCLSMDTALIGTPIDVYNYVSGGALGALVAGASATIEKVTLAGRDGYKISMPGITVSSTVNMQYSVPLTFVVEQGTIPGSYMMYNYSGSRGLLLGTTADPHSIIIVDSDNPQTSFYDDNTTNFDSTLTNDPGQHYLPGSIGSPSVVVGTLSKLEVSAEVFNNVAGDVWQDVYDAGAQATVATNGAGHGDFRLTFSNTGNTYIGNIRLLDILPFVSDSSAEEKTVLDTTVAKGSEWTAPLKEAPTVAIYDAGGSDVTSNFSIGWGFTYSTQGDPSYNGNSGAQTNGIVRTGADGFFSGNTTFTAATRSFVFATGAFRLPPSHTLVISGSVVAPAGVTASMNELVAYNAFAVQSEYFAAETSNTGTPASRTEPAKQKFILLDMDDAEISKGAYVFKDLNNDGFYTAGVDARYAGVTVELWAVDSAGTPLYTLPMSTTVTDSNGQYGFSSLPAGDYVIKVIKPNGSPYDPYAFVTRGLDGTANASHVGVSTGEGSVFTLTASTTLPAPTNAGIKATGQVDIVFMTGGTQIGATETLDVLITKDTGDVEGDIKAGSAAGEYPIPQHYSLISTETNPKAYMLTWASFTDEIVFQLELNSHDVVYKYTNSPIPAGAPAVPATISHEYGETVSVSAPTPAMRGYYFTGWTPTLASGITVSGDSFTMPDNEVVFEGTWTAIAPVENFEKTAGGTFGKVGDEVTFTVSFKIPTDVRGYEGLQIYDVLPGTLSYVSSSARIIGAGVPLSVTVSGNIISVTISKGTLQANAGAEVELVIATTVNSAWTAGNITNEAKVFVQTGTTPPDPNVDDPDDEDDATVIPEVQVALYVVRYNGNNNTGGSVPVDGKSYKNGDKVTVLARGNLTRTNYAFLGWSTNRNATSAQYKGGDTFNMGSANVVLYAIWRADTEPPTPQPLYTVTYYGNGNTGGSAPVDSNSYQSGNTVTVQGQGSLTRTNRTFLGWSTNAGATAAQYTGGSTFTITGNTLLYAVWSRETAFTVRYLPGDHGTFATQTYSNLAYGAATPVAPATTGDKGWNFTGWSPARSATVTKNVDYVARWEQELLTVRFVDWDDTLLKTEQVPHGGDATPPSNPTRDGGHTFNGWDRAYTNVQADITVKALYLGPDTGTTITPVEVPLSGGALDRILASGIPFLNIGGKLIPLYAGSEMGQSIWALLNLIMAIIGILLAIVAFVRTQKKKNENPEFEYNPEDNKEREKVRGAWLITAIIMGIAGIVLFILTEDMTRLMVLMDKWTIVNAAILIVEIIGYNFAFKYEKDEEQESALENAKA